MIMAENELQVFEKNHLAIFKALRDLKKQKEELERQEEVAKGMLAEGMEQYGIKSFKNEYITISYVEATSSETIDLKKMEEKEPELYKELLNDYKKVTNKKAYVRFTVK